MTQLPSGAYAEVFVEGDAIRKIARVMPLAAEGTKPIWAATGIGFFTGSLGRFTPTPNEVIDAEHLVLRSHAAFVRVRASGETEGRHWLLLDRADTSLRDTPRRDLQELVRLVLDLESAGLRHGDLKPDNVLVRGGRLLLCDPSSGVGDPGDCLLATSAYNPLFEASDVPALGLMLAEAEIGQPLAALRTSPTLPLGESVIAWRRRMATVGRGALADSLLSFPRPTSVGCSSDLAWEALGLAYREGRIERVARPASVADLVARIGR